MKPIHACLAAMIFLLSCFAPLSVSAQNAAPGGGEALGELSAKPWLYEVVRYLYRWHIDERDIDPVVQAGEVVFWVREVTPKLDEGDRSLFGEVILPQFSLSIRAKKADYTIPELDATVRNDTFKIVSVGGIEPPAAKPDGFAEVRAGYIEMREHLFKTRMQASFPEGELLERMRGAIRAELLKDFKARNEPVPQGAQVVHLASLSPVSNEAWVFWETGRMLIRFGSDIDLANPAVWDHEKLAIKIYRVDRNVVVSLDEVAGSNAFMTRDQAGRALFNCVILGKRLELQPPDEPRP